MSISLGWVTAETTRQEYPLLLFSLAWPFLRGLDGKETGIRLSVH